MIEDIKKILKHEAEAVLNIPVNDHYEKAIDLIISQVHKRGGKLVTSGMGKAGQIALNIATTFSSTGTPSVFLQPSEAQHGDLGVLQENDIMLLISNSGKTREIVELVPLARRLRPNVKFIVITSDENSLLAKEADVCLSTGKPKEVCVLGLTPTTSTTVMSVIGDVLVVGTMKKIAFTNEEYAKRHHGGYLGEKSRLQSTGWDVIGN
ncbi:MAG: SIS domain-containing protein [Paludibacteraceae bacterium]|nr:SIS domain-containing protein [Paludibacteraceae bacterium]